YAPGTRTFDVSLAKRIPIRNFRLQFRADAFNLLNTPQFGFPNANIGSATAGRITTTVGDNRQMQFALKLDWRGEEHSARVGRPTAAPQSANEKTGRCRPGAERAQTLSVLKPARGASPAPGD